jgi:hypothetical protein
MYCEGVTDSSFLYRQLQREREREIEQQEKASEGILVSLFVIFFGVGTLETFKKSTVGLSRDEEEGCQAS